MDKLKIFKQKAGAYRNMLITEQMKTVNNTKQQAHALKLDHNPGQHEFWFDFLVERFA